MGAMTDGPPIRFFVVPVGRTGRGRAGDLGVAHDIAALDATYSALFSLNPTSSSPSWLHALGEQHDLHDDAELAGGGASFEAGPAHLEIIDRIER